MSDLKISAIISCHHGVKTIRNAIDSLIDQTLAPQNYEIIVIDNGSSDGSTQIIELCVKQYKSIRNITTKKIRNEGLSNARNIGWQISKSPYVFYMDDDAVAKKDCLLNIVKTFRKNQIINALGGDVRILNDSSRFAHLYHYSIFNYWMLDKKLIIGTNMSFERKLLVNSGGFIKEFTYRGDESCFFLVNKKLIRPLINPSIIIFHTQPNNAFSFFKSRFENGQSKFLLKNYGSDNLIIEVIKLLIRVLSLISILILVVSLFLKCFYISISAFIFFLFRQFIQGDVLGSIGYYFRTTKSKKIKDFIEIFYFILVGNVLEDIGYLQKSIIGK